MTESSTARRIGAGPIDVGRYSSTDPFFGQPYVDLDEERAEPIPHRYVHGGFDGTDTRWAFSFPTDGQYEGRILQPLEGAHGGHENSFSNDLMGGFIGGLRMCARLGACMVESNQGHIGDDLDPKGGDDPTLYGHRASAETARLAKVVAAQAYGEAPHHAYVWGGSGGGRRSPLCLENAPDAWDGALPFVGGGPIVEHGSTEKIQGAQVMSFASMFNLPAYIGRQDPRHRRCDGARRSWRPVRRPDYSPARGTRSPVPSRLPARRRIHDRSAPRPAVAVDLDG